MSKSKSKRVGSKTKANNNNGGGKGSKAGRNKVRVSRMPPIMSDPRVVAWDRLLRDPCGADLAHPCYTGMDSGYLVRTTDFITPTITGTGFTPTGQVPCDYAIQITPFNYSATTGGVAAGPVNSGVALPGAINFGFGNMITNTTIVKRYRPVACCVRWLPSGPYSGRQGYVGIGLLQGMSILPGPTYQISQLRSLCQKYDPNGAAPHEVRWLPTAVDETFTTTAAPSDPGAGSVIFALTGVDSTVTATSRTLNGSFEVTTVWEWIPDLAAGGVTSSPQTPLPYTSQQVLATIGDLGPYIYEGVRRGVSKAGGALMQAAAGYASSQLTRGVMTSGVRGGNMIGY